MSGFSETQITQAILDAHHEKLSGLVASDVIIVGAGPSGLIAARRLAASGSRVVVLEKRLSPGGGVWGGAMGMNDVAVQDEALLLLDEAGVRHRRHASGLHVVDAVELASALCLEALRAGATVLNLTTLEDLCLRDGRVDGVVVNRTTISGVLPVDPVALSTRAVIDATGHEAEAVAALRKRGLLTAPDVCARATEGPMDAAAGEEFVVDRVAEVYPGLWVTGMSVCTTYGGPRMGPIFGGMLRSGVRVAELVAAALR